MVRAIIAGTKSQTRRLVTPRTSQCSIPLARLDFGQDAKWGAPFVDGHETQYLHVSAQDNEDERVFRVLPRTQAGDMLWVRETWGVADRWIHDCETDPPRTIAYKADLSAMNFDPEGPVKTSDWGWENMRWRPSIHLPRWASRLFLRVTAVRCEQLQEIGYEDAKAEGVDLELIHRAGEGPAFQELWDSINAKRAPWASNPWVWVIEFERNRDVPMEVE